MEKEECIILFERYIRNQATDDEVKQLADWIRSNPAISVWLERQILFSSSDINVDVQLKMLDNIRQYIYNYEGNTINKEETPKKHFRLRKWLRVAAIFIFPLITAAGVYVYMSNITPISSPLIFSAGLGQKADVILPDGSHVWLNSQSRLIYSSDYNKKERILQLDGEAYFEVAKVEDKPFIVQTKGDVEIEALGTAFSTKAYAEDNIISSILTNGKIRVSTPSNSYILLPNDRLIYDKESKQVTKNKVTNAIEFSAWRNNELRFENESLDEITKTIQRIYDVQFVFTSANLKQMRYTGTVNNTSLEDILHVITLTSPVSFLVNKNQIVFYTDEKLMKHYKQ